MADETTAAPAGEEPERPKRPKDPPLRGGVLFNRDAIAVIELPFEHELGEIEGGWRLGATQPGKLTVQLTNGHRQSFDLTAGDWLASSGRELYLSLASQPRDAGHPSDVPLSEQPPGGRRPA